MNQNFKPNEIVVLDKKCKTLLQEKDIRFVGIISNMGRQIAGGYKDRPDRCKSRRVDAGTCRANQASRMGKGRQLPDRVCQNLRPSEFHGFLVHL